MDLQTMTRRLRRDWFHRYLLDPQTYRPGTRMPAAWPNGRSVVPDVLDGRPATQIEAIWLYLSQAAAAPIPSGLIAGRMELKPRTEPILYRNFITSLSPRGIAVGYPEKVHIAWDASDASLALIWQGAFIDAAKHWVGRGQGTQEPLGDNRFSLVRGVPVGRLDDPRAQPWPTDTPIRFRGYRLSADRRPVFRYTAAGVDVIDDIKPVRDQPFSWLQRTVTISGPNTPGLYFRAASAKSVQKLADDTYLVDNAIEMNFPRSTVLMRRLGDHTELLIPVDLRGGETRIVQQLRW